MSAGPRSSLTKLTPGYRKCSLGGTSCQILAPNYNSREIPLPPCICLRPGPAAWLRVKMYALFKGLQKGHSCSCLGLSRWPVEPVPCFCLSVRTLQPSEVLTQSTDCLRLIPIKSLISISFLSLREHVPWGGGNPLQTWKLPEDS